MEDIVGAFILVTCIFCLVIAIFVPLIWAVFTIGDYFDFDLPVTIAFLIIMLYIILIK